MITPSQTSSKVRLMFDSINDICHQVVDFLKAESIETNPKAYEVGDLFARSLIDILGACVFGIKVDSFKESNNTYYKNAKEISCLASLGFNVRMIGGAICPKLMKFLGINLLNVDKVEFLKNLVLSNIKTRRSTKAKHSDFIQFLSDVHEKEGINQNLTSSEFSDDNIAYECIFLLLVGLEATTSVLNFLAYELAKNPLIQEKLFEEIQTFREELKEGKLSYEILLNMKYLDMVVSEGLRKWPSFAYHDRICTKDYTMEYETGKTYTFNKGDVIWIPFVDYHRNPKYFLHPENFDPERFSRKSSFN
uniref:Cytochrome n=1 Tax=Lutzomyia longipalpis TaxID=7200 RepID=A0A1B0CIA5_LUTLO